MIRARLAGASLAIALACARAGPGGVPAVEQADVVDGVTRIGTVVVTDRGCTFTGSAQVTAGRVSLEIRNESAMPANVFLMELAADRTFAEMAAHTEADRARIRTDQVIPGPPTWAAINGDAWGVAPGGRSEIRTLVWPAIHVVVCGLVGPGTPLPGSGRPGRLAAIDLAGPIEVRGATPP